MTEQEFDEAVRLAQQLVDWVNRTGPTALADAPEVIQSPELALVLARAVICKRSAL